MRMLIVFALLAVAALPKPSTAADAAWDSVAAVLKAPGLFTGGYYRFNLPRRDLTVRVGDVTLAPELAQGAWAGLAGQPGNAMLMGDLVVTAAELPPVLAELATQGLDVTAIHNHLVGEEPRLVYVHVGGHGPAVDLAHKLDRVLAHTATPRPVAAAAAAPVTIDTAAVFHGLGGTGRAHGAVAQISFLLVGDKVTMDGMPVPPALGYVSPVNVQAVDANRALATGDFAVTAQQVQPLLHALAANGVTATALHTHMVGEQPTLYYVHFWADGPLAKVVSGLRAAVDATH